MSDDLIRLVQRLRSAQKELRRTRSKLAEQEVQRAEKAIDAWLETHRGKQSQFDFGH